MSNNKQSWKDQLNQIIEECGDFGHNVEISKKELVLFCTKLEKLGATNIDIEDYTIKMVLPSYDPIAQRDLLLYLLTFEPHPSDVVFDKKKDRLTLDWHY
jgi:hypothetical protein